MTENSFEEKLRILHDVGNELSLASSVKDLCRKAVALGKDRLGLGRLSTWFVDIDPRFIVGSFGVDEKGHLRDELNERVSVDSDPVMKYMHANKAHSALRNDVPLRDHEANIVGHGAHIIAAIWDGKKIVGYLSTDNLLNKKSFSEHDRELVELFASTLGHLYSLKQTQAELQAAYDKLKEIQDQLIQSAKMEVVGTLASGVAHEVKNPLAVILQGVEYLARKIKARDENGHAVLLRMRIAIKKADGIIKGLLDFSASTRLDFTSQNLNTVLEQALLLVEHQVAKYRIKVAKDFMKDIPIVRIDKNKVEQVFINIILNAIGQMPKGGELGIRTYCSLLEGKRKAVFVEISDCGSGVPDNLLNRVFDPFFTTKRSSGGTGLGLSIAKNIMDMHKGRIGIQNKSEGRGAVVILAFKT